MVDEAGDRVGFGSEMGPRGVTREPLRPMNGGQSLPDPPLEREYEAWFTRALEDYMEAQGSRYFAFSVSPHTERSWPADVATILEPGKVVGFQLKRPSLRGVKHPLSRASVVWDISKPAHQRQLIKTRREIFYAFPTFTERHLRRVSLHHFVFWRQDERLPKRVYYHTDPKPGYPTRLGRTGERWGSLYERILACEAGIEIRERGLPGYIESLFETVTPNADVPAEGEDWTIDIFFLPGTFDRNGEGRRFVPASNGVNGIRRARFG